jgi:non-canonical poly(A) RNA polymerase PAPD5/7
VQELYDKKVLHRLAGISPRTTIVQDVPQLNGAARLNGGIVQSAWEPTEISQETDDEGNARKSRSTTKMRSREVIDVDADDEESRYRIPRKTRQKISEVIDAETIFTTDEGSEGDDVIVVESTEEGGSLVEEEAEYEHIGERRTEEEKKGGHVRINRKRAFWAAKAGGSSSAGPGLGT